MRQTELTQFIGALIIISKLLYKKIVEIRIGNGQNSVDFVLKMDEIRGKFGRSFSPYLGKIVIASIS